MSEARRARWRFAFETAILLVAAPPLLFPSHATVATLIALAGLMLVWVSALFRRAYLVPATPFNGAVLAWAIMVGVGTAVTSFPERTLPKATGLLLALAVWRYILLFVNGPRRLQWAWVGLAGLCLTLVVVGVLGTQWTPKLSLIRPLIEFLPAQSLVLPDAPAQGINANQLAGVLAFCLPLALGVTLSRCAPASHRLALTATRAAGAIALVLLVLLLLATQSRSGWVGTVIGTVAFLCTYAWTRPSRRWHAAGWCVLVCALALAGAGYVWIGHRALSALLTAPEGIVYDSGTLSLSGRIEIWSRALYAIRDFPFTGCGLGAFRDVVWVLYPLFRVSPGQDIAHAHNIFLQVAVDVGVPGLVAYLALLGQALIVGFRLARSAAVSSPGISMAAVALVGALVALHGYGLSDALAPGSRPAVAYWVTLGLLVAVDRIYAVGGSGSAPSVV